MLTFKGQIKGEKYEAKKIGTIPKLKNRRKH